MPHNENPNPEIVTEMTPEQKKVQKLAEIAGNTMGSNLGIISGLPVNPLNALRQRMNMENRMHPSMAPYALDLIRNLEQAGQGTASEDLQRRMAEASGRSITPEEMRDHFLSQAGYTAGQAARSGSTPQPRVPQPAPPDEIRRLKEAAQVRPYQGPDERILGLAERAAVPPQPDSVPQKFTRPEYAQDAFDDTTRTYGTDAHATTAASRAKEIQDLKEANVVRPSTPEVSESPTVRTVATPPFGNADLETMFQSWYSENFPHLNPNPDDPLHHYDYRALFLSGGELAVDPKDNLPHGDSRYKLATHPNRYVIADEGPLAGQLIDSITYTPVMQPAPSH